MFEFRLFLNKEIKKGWFFNRRYVEDKTTLGNATQHNGKVELMEVFLPAFKPLFHNEDKLIKSISKTIIHEYVHYISRLHGNRKWWTEEWALQKMNLYGF